MTYEEPLLLFRNTGSGFENVSAKAGAVFQQKFAARGMAIGDFNNDGAVDVLIAVNNGPPLLLKNSAPGGNHWLGVRLVGKRSNPDAIGARITWQAQDLKRTRLKDRRRKLSCFTRSARSPGHRESYEDRSPRDPLAAAQRQS